MLPRPSYLVLALSVMLAGCADSVSPPSAPVAAPGAASLAKGITNETSVSRFDVAFTLPAGSCGLTTTVTGTGVYLAQSRVSQTEAGEWRIGIHESAAGTATGADGSQYRFSYVANYRVLDVVEPFALPMVLDIVDHFNLLGQNGAPDIKVFLKGQFLYNGTLPLTPIGTPVIRGGLECDPL
jgi:hypothetical protein